MSALSPGKTAPPIALATLDGEKVSLGEALKKGPVLAAFFKVSCPVCQFTFPFLERPIHVCHQPRSRKSTLPGVV